MPLKPHFPVPLEQVREWIEFYWYLGMGDAAIARELKDHYDTDIYTCG